MAGQGMFRRLWARRWWTRGSRGLALAMPLVLVSSLVGVPARAAPPLDWNVPAQRERSVPGVPAVPLPRPVDRVAAAAVPGPQTVTWPAAGESTVDLSAALHAAPTATVRAGSLPVSLGAARTGPATAPAAVRVELLDRTVAAGVARDGLLLRLSRADQATASGPVSVNVDYSGFRNAYGGDWASRLRLWQLPACALATPGAIGCRGTPLPGVNNPAASTVGAEVSLPAGRAPVTNRQLAAEQTRQSLLILVTAGDSGTGGSFAATSMAPSATWKSGGSTGDFAWNYDLAVPPGLGGPTPQIGFAYSAGAVDGRISSANSQPSAVGEGFDYWPGYVERRYKGCQADGSLPTGDQCWFSDNATISLNGRASEVVRDDTTGVYRLKNDDGSTVERLSGADNGDLGVAGVDGIGEYWRVTTPDGTRYYFGLHQLASPPASAAVTGLPGAPITHSTWTLPVVGNNPGEPCHRSVYADSWCQQAWRWNLDYVVDPHGNALAYFYTAEGNRYGFTLGNQFLPYTRGGTVDRVEYGLRAGQVWTPTAAPARVRFSYDERCVPQSPCNKTSPADYPDTPWDQDCPTGSCLGRWQPTFWTSKRLAEVTTQVLRGTGYDDVDQWTLTHQFPSPGDAVGTPVLWLKTIVHTGKVGTVDVAMPPVVFDGLAMDNRINTDGLATVRKWRMTHIYNETGGSVVITYAPTECTTTNLPANAETNTKRCMPIKWTPPGGSPGQYWFHKYVVAQVDEVDGTGASAGTTTAYEYLGGAAWHYDDDDGITPAEDKTWKQWRGYGRVRTRVGSTTDGRTLSESRFYRGMNGDRLNPAGGTKTATVTDDLGGVVTDSAELAGHLRETISYLGDGGPVIARTIDDGWVSAPTATAVRPWATVTAAYTGVRSTRSQGPVNGAGMRTNTVVKTFNAHGQATLVSDLGDETVTGDEECTRITYAPNPDFGLRVLASRVERYALDCAAVPPSGEVAAEAEIISDQRTYFDGATTWGTPPTKGDITKVEDLNTWSPTGRAYVTITKVSHDAYGRGIERWDAAGQRTTTTYEPATGGPVTAFVVTNPIGFTHRTELEPANGNPLATVDANNRRTDLEYDGLGRLTKAWLPGRDKGVDAPNSQFDYLVRGNGVTAVTTRGIRADGSYNLSVEIYDGLSRPRQTQIAAPGGGRTIADTYYDSKGQIVKQHSAFWNSASPDTNVLVVTDALVPGQTRTTYDGAGRRTAEIFDRFDVEQRRTTATYKGDRMALSTPSGERATEVVFDTHGRASELREFHGPTPTGPFDRTTYTYNRRSEQTAITDPAGNVWTYTYDLRGRLVATTDPDKGASTLAYNDAGDLLSTTDARGQSVFYEYDQIGRPVRNRDGSVTGPVLTERVYDTLVKGGLTASTRYVNGNAYTTAVTGYDLAYRPTGTSVTLPAAEGVIAGTYTFDATYNPDNSPATATSPAIGNLPAETLTFGYTTEGMPYSMTSALGTYVNNTTYSPYGEITKLVLGSAPNRLSVNTTYQEGSRRTDSIRTTREGGSGDVLKSTYTFDPAGNLTKLVDTGTGQTTDTQCFGYDASRRLTRAWTPGNGDCTKTPTNTAMGGPAKYWTDWTYDTIGNRTRQVEHNTATGDVTTDYTYPAPGQPKPHTLTQTRTTDTTGVRTDDWGYDPQGNTSSRPTRTGNQTMTWDAEGHLATVTEGGNSTTYLYDAGGNRLIRKNSTGTTAYLGDTELTLTPAGTTTATRYYTFAGQTIGARTTNGLTWLISNNQGTATLAIDAANTATINRRRYTPFGELRGTAPNWTGEQGFVGGANDSAGLTHLGAREYDPDTGRFLSVDPIIDQGNPQQMHGYAYADNNPTTFSDPSGLIAVVADSGGGGSSSAGGAGTGQPTLPPDLQAMLNEAKRVQRMSLLGVILEAGGEILKELLGINDIMNCFQKGDIVACISIVANIIPWGKIFKLPKLIRAIEHAWSAVQAFRERLKWASRIVAQVDEFMKLARRAAREAAERAAAAAREAAEKAAKAAKEAAEKAAAAARRAAEKVKRNIDDGACPTSNSFLPGTAVLMADGTHKPIEQIQPGDTVLATDPTTQQTGAQAVTLAITGTGDKTLVNVAIDGDHGHATSTVTATDHHPWWLPEQGRWLTSIELKPGDALLQPDGATVRVTAITIYDARATVHNLTITDTHTYYVLAGTTPVLVHNCGTGPDGLIDLDKASQSGATPGKGGYSPAGRKLQAHADRPGTGQNWPRPSGTENPTGWNSAGQDMLDDILTHPDSIAHLGYGRVGGRWQGTLDVRLLDGRGARFDLDGIFSGFLD